MRKIRGNTVGTNMSPQKVEERIDCVGASTPEGGTVFNDYETNKATAKFATAFGSENTAAGDCSIAGGARIFKSDAEYVADEWLHGEYGFILKIYIADPNGEYAKNTIHYEEAKKEKYEAGSTHECWRDVTEWLAFEEENGFTVPDLIMTADGRFCLLEDLRYNEAYGTGAMAIGKGAVAFSRASKSFGYRTQTGYPPSEEHAKARPEAIVQTDKNGNPAYPADNVGQGAVAIGSDTKALDNNAFAGGFESIAKGKNALAFGVQAEANTDQSVALGNEAKANGSLSIALGNKAKANNLCTFAVGNTAEASGDHSVAIGNGAKTREGKSNMVALGLGTIASSWGQVAVGRYNEETPTNAVFVVGNGTADGLRSNAFVVTTDGGVVMPGGLSAYGAWVTDFSTKNATFSGDVTFRKTVTMDGGVMCWGQATFLSGLEISGKLIFDSIDAGSRSRIFSFKSSSSAPNESKAGDYVGQLWRQENDAGEVIAVYMYCGYTSATSSKHKWIKLG